MVAEAQEYKSSVDQLTVDLKHLLNDKSLLQGKLDEFEKVNFDQGLQVKELQRELQVLRAQQEQENVKHNQEIARIEDKYQSQLHKVENDYMINKSNHQAQMKPLQKEYDKLK